MTCALRVSSPVAAAIFHTAFDLNWTVSMADGNQAIDLADARTVLQQVYLVVVYG